MHALTHQFSLPLHIAELIALHSDGVWNKHCKTAFKKQVLPIFLKPALIFAYTKKLRNIKNKIKCGIYKTTRCCARLTTVPLPIQRGAHAWRELTPTYGVKGRGIIPVPSRFLIFSTYSYYICLYNYTYALSGTSQLVCLLSV